MGFIKNYSSLATSEPRKFALDIIEAGLAAIQPDKIMANSFVREGNVLRAQSESVDLSNFERIFLIGFGKGSAGISKIVESTLADKLTGGYVIDTVEQKFSKIHFTLGTHPLPSQENIDFTNNVLENIKDLTEKDLVFVVICGGGSALFESPVALSLEKLTKVFQDLLKSGANIAEMNVVRKHLSKVKGGGLAYHLYPARVISLIFSDVPGNDLSVIASGPTVKNTSTIADAEAIIRKYGLELHLEGKSSWDGGRLNDSEAMTPPRWTGELATDEKYFKNISNIIMVSNMTALEAMRDRVKGIGNSVKILSDRFQGDAKIAGKELIEQTLSGEVLLVGGETTVQVKGSGKGGRNQTVVLAALPFVGNDTLITSVGTDGVDFYYFAGAIGDNQTVSRAKEMGLSVQEYLDNDNSYEFFQKTGDGIFTDRLESNVADIILVYKL